jgi:predicted Fe-Mo cluster-binding NifX family protein
MKIAVESNDGINVASPFNLLKNFMVFEVDEKSNPININTSEIKNNQVIRLKLVRSIAETKNMLRELSDCSTVISHCLNRPLLNTLRSSGVDVYITFRNRIEDAVGQYFKDKMIHPYHEGN